MKIKAGEGVWSDAESHAVDNIGSTEVHVLNIELKEPQKKKKKWWSVYQIINYYPQCNVEYDLAGSSTAWGRLTQALHII